MLNKLSRFDEAEINYIQAIKFKPNFAEAFYNLANLLKELGRFNESIINFKDKFWICYKSAFGYYTIQAFILYAFVP